MKIFCIGYPRTGTVSIIEAFKMMGYKKVWHFDSQNYRETVNALETGIFCDKILNSHDVFADVPICCIYKNLDKLYPDSKFILTTREKNSWFDSIEWLFKTSNKRHKKQNKINKFLWSNAYPEMIEEHTKDVIEYFSDSDRLFIEDISKMSYNILANFLNIEINMKTYKRDFPFINCSKRNDILSRYDIVI
jgi:hypothetical protein